MATMNGKPIFLDTNIFLTATDKYRTYHERAASLLNNPDTRFAISGQVLREYILVATRPESENGFGMTPQDALNNIEQFRTRAVFLEETEAASRMLQKMILKYDLKGKRIHDANIAATLLAHGLNTLVTLNPNDFRLFEALTLIRL